jgi:hypothetical protein
VLVPEPMRAKAFTAVQRMIDVSFPKEKGYFDPDSPIKEIKVI